MMFLFVDPEHTRVDQHQLSVRAAERYQLERALREADERRRVERHAARESGTRRYLRMLVRHT